MKHNHATNISCSCCNPLWKSFLPKGFSHDLNTKETLQLPVSSQEHNLAQIIRVECYSELAEKASGTIITMRDGQNEKVEAIGIVGEKIVATGTYEDVKKVIKDSKATVITERALKGSQTLIPGMIDPHIHIVSTAVMNICTDVGPFDGQNLRKDYKRAFVIDTLANEADQIEAKIKDGDTEPHWILGRNVDPSLFTTGTDHEFNARTLDEISTKLPVYIMNSSGHLAYINTAAIKLLKENEVSLPENDNGILAEIDEILPVVKYILSQQDQTALEAKVDLCVDSLLAEASKRGLTTVLDAAVDPWDQTSKFNQPEYLKQKAHNANCPVRIAGALAIFSPDEFETKIDPNHLPMQGDDKFFLPFIKVVSDGSNQGLTGYQYKTYCCDEDYQAYNNENSYKNDNHGIFNFAYPNEFQAIFNKAVTRGWPLMVHANGDQAIKRTIDTFRNTGINASSIEVRRDRIEHASLITNQSFESMRDLGISPSFLIGHVGYWGWAFQQTILGKERAGLLDRCRSALQYGMKFTLHSDNGVSPLGPLRLMEQSISRFMEGASSRASNKVLTKDECITPFEALRAVTFDAAWQCHADKIVGSLEAEKYADFVILQQSPLTYLSTNPENKVANMRDIPVLETWKGAKCVYSWKSEQATCG